MFVTWGSIRNSLHTIDILIIIRIINRRDTLTSTKDIVFRTT